MIPWFLLPLPFGFPPSELLATGEMALLSSTACGALPEPFSTVDSSLNSTGLATTSATTTLCAVGPSPSSSSSSSFPNDPPRPISEGGPNLRFKSMLGALDCWRDGAALLHRTRGPPQALLHRRLLFRLHWLDNNISNHDALHDGALALLPDDPPPSGPISGGGPNLRFKSMLGAPHRRRDGATLLHRTRGPLRALLHRRLLPGLHWLRNNIDDHDGLHGGALALLFLLIVP